MPLNSNSIHPISSKLLFWYSENKRDLPWRENVKPYTIWLSEVIFQQTKIDQGLAYYNRIVNKFPTVYDLANADEQEVLKAWEGLGYYSRARNLHCAAKTIVGKFNGEFPSEYGDILSLKGVGPYTASAISSIAFSFVIPAIDGNVLRVSSRIFNIEDAVDKPSTRKRIEQELLTIIDHNNPGDFNQAMMELGALICKPRKPLCTVCPISVHCSAFQVGNQFELPVKTKKTKVLDVFFNFLVFNFDGKVIISRRKEGIWKEMYQFPLFESVKELQLDEMNDVFIRYKLNGRFSVKESKQYKHILSHRRIFAKFWMVKTEVELKVESGMALNKEELNNFPMPRLMHRFLESDEANQFLLM
jgi:A/G-specific adenine glycosylase